MILVVLAMAIVGWLAPERPSGRVVIILLGVIIVTLALARGYYWHVFARGDGWGWLTYNRGSALLIFLTTTICAAFVRIRILP